MVYFLKFNEKICREIKIVISKNRKFEEIV